VVNNDLQRGQIWWAKLAEPIGHAPGFNRPVLIVQANFANNSSLPTVICAILSSNLALAAFPGNMLLEAHETGLPKASVVNVSQLLTIDREEQLLDLVGNLTEEIMTAFDWGLARMLGLDGYFSS
jgi:mRNA interferase MazF